LIAELFTRDAAVVAAPVTAVKLEKKISIELQENFNGKLILVIIRIFCPEEQNDPESTQLADRV
jgi:hypothetical protein